MTEPIAVLLMAYGGPDRLEDVEPYLLDVRGYRQTPAAVLEEVKHRYALIGGRSPIRQRTEAQAAALTESLARQAGNYRVFVGMRHWHPFLAEALDQILDAGMRRIVGLALAPHYSQLSVEAYFERLQQALDERAARVELAAIHSWKLEPGFLTTLEQHIQAGLQAFDRKGRDQIHLVFTAHSLPERILDWQDPYPDELAATYQALRQRFPGQPAHFAYQSAAMTPEPWLGPDAGDLMERLIGAGQAKAFLVVPIGFVSEHVEILYDIDIEFKQRIRAAGGELKRIEMPGASRPMIDGLARLVAGRADEAGWL
jgi:ferrochelatase